MELEKAGLSLAKKLCGEDPVRKNIPYEWRVNSPKREIFHLEEKAVLCVAHLNAIPTTEDAPEALKLISPPSVTT